MLRPVSATRPVDVLRASSDQIRRAAELLAEITDDTATGPSSRFAALFPGPIPGDEEAESARQATILQAQRSFAAGLRLSQLPEDPHA